MAEKKKARAAETLKEVQGISNDVSRYGLSKRRLEVTRCDRCMEKVKVSAGIMMRVALTESIVVCGHCLGYPGYPEERPVGEQSGDIYTGIG